MPDLGTTTVSLRARTQQFQRQIGSAGIALRAFSSNVTEAVRSVALIGAGLAFGSAGIGGLIRGWADAATRLRELSLATDVAVPRLQQLQRIFEADGVAAEQFRFGFLRLNRTIGNALRNEFTATQVFQELGVAIRDVNGEARNAADILEDVIPALAKLPVTLQQSLGAEIFGRTYIRIATAVARVTQEAEALSKEIERQAKLFGTITDLEATELKALSQSFVDAGNAAQYYGQQVAVALGPSITGAIEGVLRAIRQNEQRFVDSLVAIAENVDLAIYASLAFAFRRVALALATAAASATLFAARFSVALFLSAAGAVRVLAGAAIVLATSLGTTLAVALSSGVTLALRAFVLSVTLGTSAMFRMAAASLVASKSTAAIGAAMLAFSRAVLATTLGLAKVIAGFAALAVVASYANQALQGNFLGFEEAIQDVIDGVERLYRVIGDIATGDFNLDNFDIGIDFPGLEADITNLQNQMRTVDQDGPIRIRVELETFGLERDLTLLQQRITILSQAGDAAARTAVEYTLLNRINEEINTTLDKQRRIIDELEDNAPGLTFARAAELGEELEVVNQRLEELNRFKANPEIFRALIDQTVEAEKTIAQLTAEREARINIDVVYRPGAGIRAARNQLLQDVSRLQAEMSQGFEGTGIETVVEQEMLAAATEYERVTDRIREANRQLSLDLPTEDVARLRAEVERLSELRINIGEFLADPNTRQNIREMATEVTELQNRLESYRRQQEFADDATSAFTDTIRAVTLGTKEGGEAVKSFIVSLADLVLQYTVLIPLARQLSTLLGGLGGVGGGGGPLGIFGFASGGFGSGLSLVGERGPELVDLGSGSRVYSNEQLANAVGGQGGGTTVVNEFNIQSTDGPGVRRALQEALPVFTDAAVNKVMGESTRPGAVRKTLRGY